MPLPAPDPSRYPCNAITCSVEMRREYDVASASYCQAAYVRIAPPLPAGAGVRAIINGLDCRPLIGATLGGMQIPMRSTSCILVSKRTDAAGNTAVEWTPRIYNPTVPSAQSCIIGVNALACIPDSVDPDTNVSLPGGLAVLFGTTDNEEASGCIGASVTTFTCGPLTFPKIKLTMKLDPALNNILECVQEKRAGVFVKEFGCGIRLSKVNRDNNDPSLGMQLKADLTVSLDTNNIASCSVDCGVAPGDAIGSLHVGFKTDSKSMVFSRVVHPCSAGRWELDAKLKLHAHESNGLYLDDDVDGSNGYYSIPEVAGGGYHIGNAVGSALTDASPNGPTLNLSVCNPSTVRYSMAVVIFRAPVVVMRIKPACDYKVGITGSFDSITVGQYYARVENPGTTTNLILTFAGYTEVILKGLPTGSGSFVASMTPNLVNNNPGVPVIAGDCQVGSYSLDAFTYTIGVDGHRVCGDPVVGPVPAVILAA